MQEISDKMSDNQFAKVTAVCMDCDEEFILDLERKSDTELEIKNGVIAKKQDTYLCIGNWNQAKRQEFGMRKNYVIK